MKLVNTAATMTAPELERLLHEETLQGLRDLVLKTTGRARRRLEDDLRRQDDWVPHWNPADGPLNSKAKPDVG